MSSSEDGYTILADDISGQMAHHVRPFYGRPTLALRLPKYWSRFAVNTALRLTCCEWSNRRQEYSCAVGEA
jgi:hypothetical protein